MDLWMSLYGSITGPTGPGPPKIADIGCSPRMANMTHQVLHVMVILGRYNASLRFAAVNCALDKSHYRGLMQ